MAAIIFLGVVLDLSYVTSALSGRSTSALLTPSKPVSADRTLPTHPTGQVIPVTLNDTVVKVAGSAALSWAGALLGLSAAKLAGPVSMAAQRHPKNKVFCMI